MGQWPGGQFLIIKSFELFDTVPELTKYTKNKYISSTNLILKEFFTHKMKIINLNNFRNVINSATKLLNLNSQI